MIFERLNYISIYLLLLFYILFYCVNVICYVQFIYSCFTNIVFYAPMSRIIFWIYSALWIKLLIIFILLSLGI